MHEPIAYTYEADVHCPACALARFGRGEYGYIGEAPATDNEGNPIGAVFSWDAFEDRDMVCGTCGEVIHELELDAVERAIREPDQRHGDSILCGILRALSPDSSNYDESTGDCSEWGAWACLFTFDNNERARIAKACGLPLEGIADTCALVVDDQGFATVASGDEYKEMKKNFTAFCEANPGIFY